MKPAFPAASTNCQVETALSSQPSIATRRKEPPGLRVWMALRWSATSSMPVRGFVGFVKFVKTTPLRHARMLHPHQQQVLGFLADGPLQEVHLHAPLAQFLQDNLLVDVVASQSVGGVHQHQVEQAVRGCVPQRIQAGPVQA